MNSVRDAATARLFFKGVALGSVAGDIQMPLGPTWRGAAKSLDKVVHAFTLGQGTQARNARPAQLDVRTGSNESLPRASYRAVHHHVEAIAGIALIQQERVLCSADGYDTVGEPHEPGMSVE
jgi:hypothetical protein